MDKRMFKKEDKGSWDRRWRKRLKGRGFGGGSHKCRGDKGPESHAQFKNQEYSITLLRDWEEWKGLKTQGRGGKR